MTKRLQESGKWSLRFVAFVAIALVGLQGEAADTAQDRLIEKLERIHIGLAAADPTKTAITLRLGDLYSERARKSAMEELSQNCTTCTAGDADRKKALSYYEQAVSSLEGPQLGRVMTQMGHLYQLLGEKQRSYDTYQTIVRQNTAPASVGEAHLALGEMLYRDGKYAEAINHYEKVLANPQTGSHGLAAYRKSWAQFNLGQTDRAIAGLREILRTPKLLNRSSSVGAAAVDPQFKEELSRDLATFLAREGAGLKEAKEIFESSPETTRLANTSYFAKELERLGQTKDSTEVWRFVLERETSPLYRLEALVLLAQQGRNLRQSEQANKDYQQALRLWPSVPQCKDPNGPCREHKSRLKNYIVDWNKVEEKTPASDGLMQAYEMYLAAFPGEKDMVLWSAQAYLGRKEYNNAIKKFEQAGALIAKELTAENLSADEKKKLNEEYETILLSQVEAGEQLGDQKALVLIYDNYLSKSRLRKEAFAVQYQKAHLLYKNEDYAKASEEMRRLALDETGDETLRLQAANLALDALVIVKDEAKIEVWGREFSQKFPKSSETFSKVSRTAVLNQAVALAKTGNKEQDQKAWETLQRMDLSTSSEEEKIAYYKNRIILAERLEKFGEARRATDEFLKIASITAEDKEFGLAKKSWYAELALDFETAFKVTQTMKLANLEPAQKSLRLALLAELADKDPTVYLNEFLKASKEADRNLAVAKSIVENSATPLKTLKELRGHFEKYPDEYGYLALKSFAKEPSMALAQDLLKDSLVTSSKSAPVLSRYVILGELGPLAASVAAHEIRSGSQSHLAADLKKRIGMIESLEKVVNKAIQSKDWTTQLVSFEVLGRESSRFYNDLLGLPLPDGLTDEEQQEYMTLLSQQAAPYQIKAQDVDAKIKEFWGNTAALNSILRDFESTQGDFRKLARQEIEALIPWANEEVRTQLNTAMAAAEAPAQVPRVADIEAAKRKVRENPLSVDPLAELIGLEKKLGRHSVVSYLEARLTLVQDGQLYKGQTQQGGQ